jgi:hypothetical protein
LNSTTVKSLSKETEQSTALLKYQRYCDEWLTPKKLKFESGNRLKARKIKESHQKEEELYIETD